LVSGSLFVGGTTCSSRDVLSSGNKSSCLVTFPS
jgi:hypothetical protein